MKQQVRGDEMRYSKFVSASHPDSACRKIDPQYHPTPTWCPYIVQDFPRAIKDSPVAVGTLETSRYEHAVTQGERAKRDGYNWRSLGLGCGFHGRHRQRHIRVGLHPYVRSVSIAKELEPFYQAAGLDITGGLVAPSKVIENEESYYAEEQ